MGETSPFSVACMSEATCRGTPIVPGVSLRSPGPRSLNWMLSMTAQDLYFDSIKEHRGSYFVEYRPPSNGCSLAILTITFLGSVDSAKVIQSMETELAFWLSRYPIPLMVFGYDEAHNPIAPRKADETCLVGWIAPGGGDANLSWNLNDLSNHLDSAPAHPDWRTIYSDIPFRTGDQIKEHALRQLREQRKGFLVLKLALSMWLAVIPATFAIAEFLGPQWLGAIVLAYSLWKAWRVARELWGHSTPSPSASASREKQRKMDHYFYHCERNPSGFARLVLENFDADARERTRIEAAQIAANSQFK